MRRSLLRRAPTVQDLQRMYHELARRGAAAAGAPVRWPYAPATEEQLVLLAVEMSRFDPRLLGILVGWLLTSWDRLDPLQLRRGARTLSEPAALGVVAQLAREATEVPEAIATWQYIQGGLQPGPVQLYFLRTYPVGGRLARRAAERSPAAFLRWGFLAHERPTVDTRTKRRVGRYDAPTRSRILGELMEAQRGIGLQEYLAAVDQSVSRQQALADLRGAGLRPTGRGPTARWQAPPAHARRAATPHIVSKSAHASGT